MKTSGKLIVIDGSDGVGKATQTKLLVERLKKSGKKVETLDFPQYEKNFFGSFLKECLTGKHGDFIGQNPYLVSIAYAADRWESKAKLEKWLKDGRIVVLNRYVSSNQMHQGGKITDTKARRAFLTWLERMEHTTFGLPRPDIILYLHVPVELSIQLMKGRGNEDLAESDPKHLARAQDAALKIIRSQGNWQKIDCTVKGEMLPRPAIHDKIFAAIRSIVKV
jgi:dTMP kinase